MGFFTGSTGLSKTDKEQIVTQVMNTFEEQIEEKIETKVNESLETVVMDGGTF